MMKAAVLRAPGGFDRIKVHDVPDPNPPGPGQIRIALHATSLNYHDLLVASGTIPAADGRVLMSDGAGVVEAVGEGVAEFRPGDRRRFHRRAADREDDRCGGYCHLVV